MKTKIQILMASLMLSTSIMLTAQTKPIDVSSSSIHWVGSKVISGSHEGTMKFKSGAFTFKDDVITGGEFVVDMTTINCTDLEGDWKMKLEGHLKSDDFFGVESHPEASLTIEQINAVAAGGYSAVGNFTIKGETQSIPFTIQPTDNGLVAEVTVDRTKHSIRYGSDSFFDNLGDKAISNDFNLTVTLNF